MPRQRSPNRDKAKELYISSKGSIPLKDIATELNIKDTQVRKWKSQDKWDEELKGNVTKPKRNVTKQNKGIEEHSEIELPIEELETLANEEIPDKQRLFCLYYIKYRNKVKAYQMAYNSSYITACGNASNLFKNIEVQQCITELLKEVRNEIKIEAIDIINEHMKIAFADITDYISFGIRTSENGKRYTFIEFNESNEVDGTLIQELKQGRDGVSLKLKDGQKSLNWLYDHCIVTEEQKERINLLKAQTNKLQGEKTDLDEELIIKVDYGEEDE